MTMNVIWKRPDGYHGAQPTDFRVMPIGENYSLWLHRSNKQTFPFRVSGGWEEEEQTRRLNGLVNMLDASEKDWNQFLDAEFDKTMHETRAAFFADLKNWLGKLKSEFKGGSWEMEIMGQTFDAVARKLVE